MKYFYKFIFFIISNLSINSLHAKPIDFYLFVEAGPGESANITQGGNFATLNGIGIPFHTKNSGTIGKEYRSVSIGTIDSSLLKDGLNSLNFSIEIFNNGICSSYRKFLLKVNRKMGISSGDLLDLASLEIRKGQKNASFSTTIDLTLEKIAPIIAHEQKVAKEKAINEETENEHRSLLDTLGRLFNKENAKKLCFTEGTKIKAVDASGQNTYRDLHTIAVGDKVWSCNFTNNACELRPVKATGRREVGKVVQIATDSENIEVTPEHPFYVPTKGWVQAKMLKVGDKLQSRMDTTSSIAAIDEIDGQFTVYNIEVDAFNFDNQNYFVTESDLLVHNCNILQDARVVVYGATMLAGGSTAGVVIALEGGITILRVASGEELSVVAKDAAFDAALAIALSKLGIAAKHLEKPASRVLEFLKQNGLIRDMVLTLSKNLRSASKKVGLDTTNFTGVTKEIESHSPGKVVDIYEAAAKNKPLGRGTTGRSEPKNLQEQAALLVTRADPQNGKVVLEELKDARWPAGEEWQKMRTSFDLSKKSQDAIGKEKITIHYLRNAKTGIIDDIKFKD